MANEPGSKRKEPNRFSRGLLWLVGAAAAMVMVYQVADEAQRAKLLSKGSVAPPFVVQRFTGGELQSEQLRGKVVMLDFWATWCAPCVEEMPALFRLAQEFETKGLVFVAANRDDPSAAASAISRFVSRTAPRLGPSIVYASDQMSSSYRAEVLPTLYFIDREGRILDASVGYASEASLRRRIERSLK